MANNTNSRETNSKKNLLKLYGRYSVVGVQMAAIIVIMSYAGLKLDEWLKTENSIFTIVLSLLSIAAAMYFAIKDLIKKK